MPMIRENYPENWDEIALGIMSEAKAAQHNSETMGRRGRISRVVRPVLRSERWPDRLAAPIPI